MIRIASNRNSRAILLSVALFFIVSFFFLVGGNSPSYRSQLSDSEFLKTAKEKAASFVDTNPSSYQDPQKERPDYDDFKPSEMSAVKDLADSGKGALDALATTSKSSTIESETANFGEPFYKDTSKGSEHPPKPPYPQGPSKEKTAVKEKVKADKAFSSSEQQKDGKSKSYKDDGTKYVVDKAPMKSDSLSYTSSGSSSSSESCDEPKYVVMIDAGSSGSRVHVYKFDTCSSPPKLLNEEFKMLKPGLSSFDTDISGAAHSLDPLLELAVKSVPKSAQKCTPIAVKATAGLRLLGTEKSTAILKEVRRYLEEEWPFAVVSGDGISIMDGADEGVFAWITANYLMGNIGSSEKTPTAAVFDLGGGSTQIVFEPDFTANEKFAEGDHKYEISFGNRDFELYQFSHLGYGLMEGRQKIYKVILDTYLNSDKKPTGLKPITSETEATVDIISPCVAPGNTAKNVKVRYSSTETYLVNFVGPEKNMGAQCRFLAEKVLNKDEECKTLPCSFNGAYQPSLMKNFKSTSDLYIFSFFYDRTNPMGMPSSFSLEEMIQLTSVVCSGDSFWEKMLGSIEGSVEELTNEPNYCLDLSFMVAMLHTGYEIPLNRELKTAKKIAGNELGWCLGASLPLLEKKGWKCKVDKE